MCNIWGNNRPNSAPTRVLKIKSIDPEDGARFADLQYVVVIRIIQLVISQDYLTVNDNVHCAVSWFDPGDRQDLIFVKCLDLHTFLTFLNCFKRYSFEKGLFFKEVSNELLLLCGLMIPENLHISLESWVNILFCIIQNDKFNIVLNWIFNVLTRFLKWQQEQGTGPCHNTSVHPLLATRIHLVVDLICGLLWVLI